MENNTRSPLPGDYDDEETGKGGIDYSFKLGRMVRRRQHVFYVGRIVGKLTVKKILKADPDSPVYRRTQYLCQCECGREIEKTYHQLFYASDVTGCGICAVPNRVGKHAGETFGRLVVGEWVVGKGWECMCSECGELEYVRYSHQLVERGDEPCYGSGPVKTWRLRIAHPDEPTNCVKIQMQGRSLKEAYDNACKVLVPYAD